MSSLIKGSPRFVASGHLPCSAGPQTTTRWFAGPHMRRSTPPDLTSVFVGDRTAGDAVTGGVAPMGSVAGCRAASVRRVSLSCCHASSALGPLLQTRPMLIAPGSALLVVEVRVNAPITRPPPHARVTPAYAPQIGERGDSATRDTSQQAVLDVEAAERSSTRPGRAPASGSPDDGFVVGLDPAELPEDAGVLDR